MLYDFLSLFTTFFASDLFSDYLLIFFSFGLVPAVIYMIWRIVRGYVK